MRVTADLRDVTGNRGESILELCLTDYRQFDRPLFSLSFLGEKWPVADYYVELKSVPRRRPYFFVQCKATSSVGALDGGSIRISATKRDVERLLQMPGPTYILGVHEPTQRVFVKGVHAGIARKGIKKISVSNELTPENLRRLYNEVKEYWSSTGHKPAKSVFV
jgi:hypothetical protein